MNCRFAMLSGRLRCLRCGRELPLDGLNGLPVVECRGRGLGDVVAGGLAAVGITEERVSRAIGRPCGCGRRAAAMNAFGAKYLGLPPGSKDGKSDSGNVPP